MSRKSSLPQPAQSVMSADGGQLRVLGVAFAGASCEYPAAVCAAVNYWRMRVRLRCSFLTFLAGNSPFCSASALGVPIKFLAATVGSRYASMDGVERGRRTHAFHRL